MCLFTSHLERSCLMRIFISCSDRTNASLLIAALGPNPQLNITGVFEGHQLTEGQERSVVIQQSDALVVYQVGPQELIDIGVAIGLDIPVVFISAGSLLPPTTMSHPSIFHVASLSAAIDILSEIADRDEMCGCGCDEPTIAEAVNEAAAKADEPVKKSLRELVQDHLMNQQGGSRVFLVLR